MKKSNKEKLNIEIDLLHTESIMNAMFRRKAFLYLNNNEVMDEMEFT